MITDINAQYESDRRAAAAIRSSAERRRRSTASARLRILAEFSSAPLTGKSVRFETYFPPLDKHFSISVAPIGADGFATIFFDVTAMRKSQEEHQTLSALVENSNEFIGLASLDGRLLYLNEAGRRLAGLGQDHRLDGLTIFDFVPRPSARGSQGRSFRRCGRPATWSGEGSPSWTCHGRPVPVDSASS